MAFGFHTLTDPKLIGFYSTFTILDSTKLAHRFWSFSHSQLLGALSDLELSSYMAGTKRMKIRGKGLHCPLA